MRALVWAWKSLKDVIGKSGNIIVNEVMRAFLSHRDFRLECLFSFLLLLFSKREQRDLLEFEKIDKPKLFPFIMKIIDLIQIGITLILLVPSFFTPHTYHDSCKIQ